MGLWGVIRERSCRWAADSRPMSCSDSQTFFQLGPVLCKGLRWVAMIHPSSREKHEAVDECWSAACHTWKHPGQPKVCRAVCKASSWDFSFACESQDSLGHRLVTCLANASVFKRKPRSYNCSACRNNGLNQGCEMICTQFGRLQFICLCLAQIHAYRPNWYRCSVSYIDTFSTMTT